MKQSPHPSAFGPKTVMRFFVIFWCALGMWVGGLGFIAFHFIAKYW